MEEISIKALYNNMVNIKIYAKYMCDSITDTIEDYIDDDRVRNRDIIGQLKEERERWRDILKIAIGEYEALYNTHIKGEMNYEP